MSFPLEPSLVSYTRSASPDVSFQDILCISLIAFITRIKSWWKKEGERERGGKEKEEGKQRRRLIWLFEEAGKSTHFIF